MQNAAPGEFPGSGIFFSEQINGPSYKVNLPLGNLPDGSQVKPIGGANQLMCRISPKGVDCQ